MKKRDGYERAKDARVDADIVRRLGQLGAMARGSDKSDGLSEAQAAGAPAAATTAAADAREAASIVAG